MTAKIFDEQTCTLGEGPLWHPERKQLFWFDILENTLHTHSNDGPERWHFDEHVSAAGWVDINTLLIASETALMRFDIPSGETTYLHSLEAENTMTRSNDGRADPWGGFWIGTMGKAAEKDAGAIYRYYQGELRTLYSPITIPNAICFTPDRNFAFYADTVAAKIWRQALDAEDGWPVGEPEVFLDFRDKGIFPDGAVCDADGYLWNAQWGAGRVVRYAPDGKQIQEIALPTDQTTCPAFGGPDMQTMYVTSAAVGLKGQDDAGKTFMVETGITGQAEPRVILD